MGIINFVWAGGAKALPTDSIKNIYKWQEVNPNTQIFLWIHMESLSLMTARSYALEAPHGLRHSKIKLMSITKLEKLIEEYHFLDPSFAKKLKVLFQIALHEGTRLRPNFGASSDIFRYIILFFNSGVLGNNWSAYFDHDVAPGTKAIESTFQNSKKTFFLSVNSQESGFSGNDALIFQSPHHVVLKNLLEYISDNYTGKKPPVETLESIYSSQELNTKAISTICRTGPRALTHTLLTLYLSGQLDGWSEENFQPDIDNCTVISTPEAFSIPKSVCPGNYNLRAWLSDSLQPMFSEKSALQNAIANITLDVNLLKILRLDDHVKNILDSLALGKKRSDEPIPEHYLSTEFGIPTEFEQVIAKELTKHLERLDCSLVTRRQLISRYQVIRDYYSAHVTDTLDINEHSAESDCKMFENLTGVDDMIVRLPQKELIKIMNHWISSMIPFFERPYLSQDQSSFICKYISTILDLVDATGSEELEAQVEKSRLGSYLSRFSGGALCLTPLADSVIDIKPSLLGGITDNLSPDQEAKGEDEGEEGINQAPV